MIHLATTLQTSTTTSMASSSKYSSDSRNKPAKSILKSTASSTRAHPPSSWAKESRRRITVPNNSPDTCARSELIIAQSTNITLSSHSHSPIIPHIPNSKKSTQVCSTWKTDATHKLKHQEEKYGRFQTHSLISLTRPTLANSKVFDTLTADGSFLPTMESIYTNLSGAIGLKDDLTPKEEPLSTMLDLIDQLESCAILAKALPTYGIMLARAPSAQMQWSAIFDQPYCDSPLALLSATYDSSGDDTYEEESSIESDSTAGNRQTATRDLPTRVIDTSCFEERRHRTSQQSHLECYSPTTYPLTYNIPVVKESASDEESFLLL